MDLRHDSWLFSLLCEGCCPQRFIPFLHQLFHLVLLRSCSEFARSSLQRTSPILVVKALVYHPCRLYRHLQYLRFFSISDLGRMYRRDARAPMLHPEMDDGIFLNEGHRDVMPGMRPRRCAKRVVHRIRLDLEVVTGLWGPRPSQTRGNQWCLQIMGLGKRAQECY